MAQETYSEVTVGVGPLRVLISESDDGWFAQGLEVDYAAAGTSFDDVKQRFENGLAHTIGENLVLYGHLDHLGPAPPEAWRSLQGSKKVTQEAFESQLVYTLVRREPEDTLPFFESIAYYQSGGSCLPA